MIKRNFAALKKMALLINHHDMTKPFEIKFKLNNETTMPENIPSTAESSRLMEEVNRRVNSGHIENKEMAKLAMKLSEDLRKTLKTIQEDEKIIASVDNEDRAPGSIIIASSSGVNDRKAMQRSIADQQAASIANQRKIDVHGPVTQGDFLHWMGIRQRIRMALESMPGITCHATYSRIPAYSCIYVLSFIQSRFVYYYYRK